MHEIFQPELFRGIERLIIVAFGGLSIYLGFRLFDRASVTAGEMSAQAGSISLTLRKVWPGVFFAAFGMFILVISMLSRLERPSTARAPTAQASLASVGDTGISWGQPRIMSGKHIRIHAALQGTRQAMAFVAAASDNSGGSQSMVIEQLHEIKNLLLDDIIPPEKMQDFNEKRALLKQDKAAFDKMGADVRAEYERIRVLVEG